MTVKQFKRDLAALIAQHRNREAIDFVTAQLPSVRAEMTGADRMLVADWMEGVETALEVESAADHGASGLASST